MGLSAYLFELGHGEGEEVDKLLLILVHAHTSDLSQTFQSHIAKHGYVQELKKKTQQVSADMSIFLAPIICDEGMHFLHAYKLAG